VEDWAAAATLRGAIHLRGLLGRPDELVAIRFEIMLSPAEVAQGLRALLSPALVYDVLIDDESWGSVVLPQKPQDPPPWVPKR